MTSSGRHIEIRGTVQGVGFRPWVYQMARRSGLRGAVRNDSGGVVIDAFGPVTALETFIRTLECAAPPAARVSSVIATIIPWRETDGFTIDKSGPSDVHRVSIPADLATCDECLGEILDPANRRYRYAFTNCTNCGPRYSIVTGAPYDRDKTSMARFTMCDDCAREYEDPLDRRFHAQPNACAKCGPHVTAMSAKGETLKADDPVNFGARALRAGLIAGLKGIGGFHLACDATSSHAVRRLRERKRRDAKPFAVMVATIEMAEAIAVLTDAERELLQSIERPVVLVRMREHAPIAREVTEGIPLIGLFLPYSPLHHLLLRDAATPLVMTSGNLSDEPMVTSNEDALQRLGDIADLFLMHDRDIVTRVDDSVARVIDAKPVVIRRARGFVPRSIDARREFVEPVLACGAHLKNTFCIATGNTAFLGPHIGDLETADTLRDYERAITRMKEFAGVDPKVVAHDLHPDLFSTRYALAQIGVRTIGVQHHHAHIASAMAEHGLEGPVVGIAYDGTGFGTDGTSWGGEILIAGYEGFRRFASFRPMALPGGDSAVRQPWRVALALVDEAFHGEPPLHAIPLFRDIAAPMIATTRRMIASRLNTPLARGVGRLFDALGSIILGMPHARYEGDVAFQWNMIADSAETGVYPIVIREGSAPWEIDPRPMVRAAVADFIAGRSAATISARFHNTLADATIAIARAAVEELGAMPVVLSGGCFQNARLTESVSRGLRDHARVFTNQSVPPGDGGIALGQAFVAAARLRAAAFEEKEIVVCV